MNIFGIQTAVVQTSKTSTWLKGCQNVLSSRQIIINSWRLWNSHQGTNSWGPWHLATFWNVESRKWHFQGVFKRYSPPPRMPCCFVRIRARLGTILSMSQAQISKRIVWTFQRSTPVFKKICVQCQAKLGNRWQRFCMVTPQDFAEQSVSRVRISITKEV